jgi:hypothetical protein
MMYMSIDNGYLNDMFLKKGIDIPTIALLKELLLFKWHVDHINGY